MWFRKKRPAKKHKPRRAPDAIEFIGFLCPGNSYPPRQATAPQTLISANGGELHWNPDGAYEDEDPWEF